MYTLKSFSRRKCQAVCITVILFSTVSVFLFWPFVLTTRDASTSKTNIFGLYTESQRSANYETISPCPDSLTYIELEVPKVPEWSKRLYYQSSLEPILGNSSSSTKRKFLTIGISTVYREEEYLKSTLSSLINQSWPEEREVAVVVIYLADTDSEKRELQLKLIQSNFKEYLDSGFIEVITSTEDIYPPLNFALTKRNFNDSVDRVIWRTKQVIDFAFLFSYVHKHQISEYLMITEDDVIASIRYITAIREFVQLKKRVKYFALHFTTFLGIGLTFRFRDLERLIQFLLMFHQEQPVDMLIEKFIMIQSSDELETGIATRYPSIFQHIGIKSTLPSKLQKTRDSTFKIAQRIFKNQNPTPMRITTTMTVLGDFVPKNAYSHIPGWFCGIPYRNVEEFTIKYDKPINVSRIAVFSGFLKPGLPDYFRLMLKMNPLNLTQVDEFIRNATLQISSQLIFDPLFQIPICSNFTTIGKFEDGYVDVKIKKLNIGTGSVPTALVQCIRILIRPLILKTPIVIREIEVFS